MDCDNLMERLTLSAQMLRQKELDLRAKLREAGIQYRRGEDESDDGNGSNKAL